MNNFFFFFLFSCLFLSCLFHYCFYFTSGRGTWIPIFTYSLQQFYKGRATYLPIVHATYKVPFEQNAQ